MTIQDFKDYIQKLFINKPRTKPEKIWCFYSDPYRKGFAATGLTAAAISSVIITIFAIIGLIALFFLIVGFALYLVFGAALIALGASGLYGFKEGGKVGIFTTIITIAIASCISSPLLGFAEGIMEWARAFSENLNYASYVLAFLGDYWPIILGIVVAPATVVLAIAGLFIFTIYSFRGFEKAVLWFHGIRQPCPVCSEKTEPAKYKCPNCNTVHKQSLIPSQYGVFKHLCAACEEPLPTMLLFSNKIKLPHNCPHCDEELVAGVLGTDRHIAFVGGRNSGKSCMLLQSTQRLLDIGATIPESDQEREFKGLQSLMFRGEVPPQTQRIDAYRAFQVEMENGLFPIHFHFYDIAGENFEDASSAKAQQFFKNVDAIIFVFDPFFDTSFKLKYPAANKIEHVTQPPSDIMRNLIQALEKYNSDTKRLKRIALNIMMVKTDTGYLKNVVSTDMSNTEREAAIKQFIIDELGQSSFIQLVEQFFSKINYTYSSALGRVPEVMDRSPFSAEHLDLSLDPTYKQIKIKLPV